MKRRADAMCGPAQAVQLPLPELRITHPPGARECCC
jgi:hypothetical protein